MTSQTEIVKFIDETLAGMTTAPAFWGPLPCVELQVLRLLEVRLLLVVPGAVVDKVSSIAQSYWEELDAAFPGTPPVSLRTRVDNDPVQFSRWLTSFCQKQQEQQDKQAEPTTAGERTVIPLRVKPRADLPQTQPWNVFFPPSNDRVVSEGASSLPR